MWTSCSPGWTPGRPTTRTWPRPTPPGRPRRTCPHRGGPTPTQLRKRLADGEWVVDLRNRVAFAAGHVAGTLNFGLDGSFATYLGWLIPWGTPLTLLGETAEQVAEAQRELVRIGIDRPAAHATGDPADWAGRGELGTLPAGHVRRPGPGPPPPAGRRARRPPQPGMGRRPTSTARCTSRCTNCSHRLDEVPDGEVWVHCAAGYRASIAASHAGRRRTARRRRRRRLRPGPRRRTAPSAPARDK